MSETLCTLRTKGGGGAKYTETSLWTNPSPNSTFAAQAVTLSDSIDNYKYIKIKHKDSTSGSDILEVICSVADLKESIFNKGAVHSQLAIDMQNSGNTLRSRAVGYVSSTSIQFSACYNCNATGSDNTCAIPLEILGLNELATGHRLRETILWTNSAPTSSFSGQTVTLSEDLSNYDMVRLYWRKTTSDSSEMYIDVRVSDYTSITANTGSFQLYMGYRHSNGGCGRSVSGSGTTAKFGNCYFFGSATAANNANAIPTKIAGLRIS